MKVRAVFKDVRISPRKARLVVDSVRGKKVEEALSLLRLYPTPVARVVAKAIKSAAANAENNFDQLPSELRVVEILVDQGHTMRRGRAQARGRSSPILKRSSHITVAVEEE